MRHKPFIVIIILAIMMVLVGALLSDLAPELEHFSATVTCVGGGVAMVVVVVWLIVTVGMED